MKTKDFIKMLQEVDPSGEGYIRIPENTGAPWIAEKKDGSWDGPYAYFELLDPENGNQWNNLKLVISTTGYKIDIKPYDIQTLVWDQKGNIDEIKKRICFDFKNICYPEEYEKRIWHEINQYIDEYNDYQLEKNKKGS